MVHVIDATQNPIHNGNMESVNALKAITNLKEPAIPITLPLLLCQQILTATLVLSSTNSRRNVWPALMVVWPVLHVMLAPNVDQNILTTL